MFQVRNCWIETCLKMLVNLNGILERFWLYCTALTCLLWSGSHLSVQLWKNDYFFGSCGKPCSVAEGLCEGSGGMVSECSDSITVRSSETLPAECLEQAYCSKYQLLRLLPTCSWGSWFPYADEDFFVKSLIRVKCYIWLCLGYYALIWLLDKGCFPLLCLAQLVCWLLLWPVAQSLSNVWNGTSGFQTCSSLLNQLLIHGFLTL